MINQSGMFSVQAVVKFHFQRNVPSAFSLQIYQIKKGFDLTAEARSGKSRARPILSVHIQPPLISFDPLTLFPVRVWMLNRHVRNGQNILG